LEFKSCDKFEVHDALTGFLGSQSAQKKVYLSVPQGQIEGNWPIHATHTKLRYLFCIMTHRAPKDSKKEA
jgi:hypothetical protein